MSSNQETVNVVIAGIGGQGAVKASDILSRAAFLAGLDIKKSEIHGMSQRGGSVSSDVRFGEHVDSPMVPLGEADFLVVLEETQVVPNMHRLRPGGVCLTPDCIPFIMEDTDDPKADALRRRTMNVALLGVLSSYIDSIAVDHWLEAVRLNVPPKFFELNRRMFQIARGVELLLRRQAV